MPALRDQVDAALAAAQAHRLGRAARRPARVPGRRSGSAPTSSSRATRELQQAVRFALFHVLQAGARAERRAIPAKGLTGRGYDGHTFWDMETFVAAGADLHGAGGRRATRCSGATRRSTWPRRAPSELGLAGAAFPWRTIRGEECSGYWPAGTAALHINADIADAVRRYVAATGDDGVRGGPGLELLVETARLWRSVGHHDAEGGFRIDGVTGPDEYTRARRQQRLHEPHGGAEPPRPPPRPPARHPQRAAELGVDEEEIAAWRDAADAMVVPFDDELGVHPQAEGFTRHAPLGLRGDARRSEYPLLLHFPYYRSTRARSSSRPTSCSRCYLCGDRFTPSRRRATSTTTRRSRCATRRCRRAIQAIVAAEVGHLDLAYDYLGETALIDLRDLADNTDDGLHIASLGGAWLAVVAGFGGMRDHGDRLAFAPRLPGGARAPGVPPALPRAAAAGRDRAAGGAYELVEGEGLAVLHHGEGWRSSRARR